jgi:hypothetical protein
MENAGEAMKFFGLKKKKQRFNDESEISIDVATIRYGDVIMTVKAMRKCFRKERDRDSDQKTQAIHFVAANEAQYRSIHV